MDKERKIVVFGTGEYYRTYKGSLNDETIVYLADNNPQKAGQLIDGIPVKLPGEIDYSDIDFVIIMVLDGAGIKEQLLSIGISAQKILYYYEYAEKLNKPVQIRRNDTWVSSEKWLSENSKHRILVISHDFSRTGVPVVGMYTANLLKKMGYGVVYGALKGGTLTEELESNHIEYMEYINTMKTSRNHGEFWKNFDAIIICTIAASDFIQQLEEYSKPIIWWLNESYESLYKKHRLVFDNNISYYADGRLIEECFKKNYPQGSISQLLYFLPENIVKTSNSNEGSDKIRIAIVGAICERKGQDIVLSAIKRLPQDVLEKCKFIFLGNDLDELGIDWDMIVKENPSISYSKEISQEELAVFFSNIDLLICPSREDSGPVVVTQAFQNSVPCVLSDGVGQSDYMIDDFGGWVFRNENADELAKILSVAVSNPATLTEKGNQGRMIYEKYFSEQAHRETLKKILGKYDL